MNFIVDMLKEAARMAPKGKLIHEDRKTWQMVRGAMQHWLSPKGELSPEAKSAEFLKAQAQYWGTPGDFPDAVLPNIARFVEELTYDNAFEQVFKMLDFTNENVNGFTLYDVANGLAFSEVPLGGDAKIYGMSGAKVEVTFAKYMGGLQWPAELIEDAQYWQMADNANAFRNKAGAARAAVFYTLIEAVAGQDLVWQPPTPALLPNTAENYTAIRDFNTINKACENIVTDLKNSSIPVSMNSVFVVLYPYQLAGRMARAQGVLNKGISDAHPGTYFNWRPVMTTGLSSATSYYVALPGQKAIGADRIRLQIRDRYDLVSDSDVMVGRMRFGGAIGEPNQFQKCAIA